MTHTPQHTATPVPLDKLTETVRATHYIGEHLDCSAGALRDAPALLREMADTLEKLNPKTINPDLDRGEIGWCIGGALALLDTAARVYILQEHGVPIGEGHPANIPVRALNDALDMFDNYVTETSTPLTEACLEGAQVALTAYRDAFRVYDFLDAYTTATQ